MLPSYTDACPTPRGRAPGTTGGTPRRDIPRSDFPNDDAVIELLWLAIRDIEDKRARARAKEKGLPANERKAPGRLVEGAVVQGWKAALGALALAYPDRIGPYLT